MTTRAVLLLGSVLGALGPVSIAAQSLDSAAARAERSICLYAKPGILVRVATGTHGSQVGPVVRCDDSEIVLGPSISQEAPEYTVPRSAVRRVWVRRNAGPEGLAVGIVAGGASGGFFAGLKSNICYTSSGTVNCHGNVTAGIAAGAVVGGLIGWVLGSGFPHWKRVYP